MTYYNYLFHEQEQLKNRPIEEIAYEIEHAYNTGYENSQYKLIIFSILDNYERFGKWTVKQDMVLRNHLAHIKAGLHVN